MAFTGSTQTTVNNDAAAGTSFDSMTPLPQLPHGSPATGQTQPGSTAEQSAGHPSPSALEVSGSGVRSPSGSVSRPWWWV